MRKDVPLELLGPLGCGIQTGAGAVLNALRVRSGSSFVAFGAGAAGLAAVMAARVAGATIIITADVNPAHLQLALEPGATHVINSMETDTVAAVREPTGGGADFTLECSGRPAVLRRAIDSLAILATCAIVGAMKEDTEVAFNVNDAMIPGRRTMGIVQGGMVSRTFIPVRPPGHVLPVRAVERSEGRQRKRRHYQADPAHRAAGHRGRLSRTTADLQLAPRYARVATAEMAAASAVIEDLQGPFEARARRIRQHPHQRRAARCGAIAVSTFTFRCAVDIVPRHGWRAAGYYRQSGQRGFCQRRRAVPGRHRRKGGWRSSAMRPVARRLRQGWGEHWPSSARPRRQTRTDSIPATCRLPSSSITTASRH